MDIPDKIYLLVKDEDGEEPDKVMWCEDRIHDTDIEYVRTSLIGIYSDYWCDECEVESKDWVCETCSGWCKPVKPTKGAKDE